MTYIKQYEIGSKEYQNLVDMSQLLIDHSPNRYFYFVRDTFFDVGQGWKYTTILCEDKSGKVFQCLNPKQYGDVVNSTCSLDLKRVLNDYLGGRFCPDRDRTKDIERTQKIYQFSLR